MSSKPKILLPRIVRMLQSNSLTAKQMAERMGCSPNTITEKLTPLRQSGEVRLNTVLEWELVRAS